MTSVNSPLKPPTQNQNKEGTPKDGVPLRKISVSQLQNSPGAFGVSSPTTSRPGNRRRETSDSYPFPPNSINSPAPTSRFSRDESNTAEPPPALLRRRTDLKDAEPGPRSEDRDKEKVAEGSSEDAQLFGALKRSSTGPFGAGLNGASSPWSSTSQTGGFSAMGSFGSFALGSTTGQASTPSEKRSGLGGVRGESRFKGLMAKESAEEGQRGLKSKPSLGTLEKVNETEPDREAPSWMEARTRRPLSNDTDPYPDEDVRTGSAALGGGQDTSPPRRQGFQQFGTPNCRDSQDDSGISAFGMTADTMGFRDILHARDAYMQHTPQQRDNSGGLEPMSPTDTNPYQSPPHGKPDSEDIDTDGSDIQNAHLPGLGSLMAEVTSSGFPGLGGAGSLGRAPAQFEAAASDRSQTSSTGPPRGFPSLGGFGGLPGLGGSVAWPAGPAAVGTPGRERSGLGGAFGDGLMGAASEVQSPSLAGLGSSGLFGSGIGSGLSSSLGGSGTLGRSSKMGSLFPAAMQEQMRAGEQTRQQNENGSVEGGDQSQPGTSAFVRNAFGSNAPGGADPARTESPFRTGRGLFDDLLGSALSGSTLRNSDSGFLGGDSAALAFSQAQSGIGLQTPTLGTSIQGAPGQPRNAQQTAQRQAQSVTSSASNQPPAAQQRTMVMPDRMRWVYRDPQGNIQGPWSGLEMHDWYKAGFFSPELLVKKYEDPDYEPLAQLIRRIGNSREPFLVPQIGIPHGPPTTQAGNAWAGQPSLASPSTSSAAQPPFASSFPSFGTTLTADQQNALERRKQEEQYLMARQKEHLAQQQVLVKQMQLQGQHGVHPQQLHHHSSAHSLHSQPSFGSIASPVIYQPSPVQGPAPTSQGVPGFFDNSFRPPPTSGLGAIGGGIDVLGNIREEDVSGVLERMNLGRSAQPAYPGTGASFSHPQEPVHVQQIAVMLNDRARLQREQAEHDAMQQRFGQHEHQATQASADRLQQFHDLRARLEAEQSLGGPIPSESVLRNAAMPSAEAALQQLTEAVHNMKDQVLPTTEAAAPVKQPEPLSLTEQVQKAASAKQSPAPQSPWAKIDTVLPHPFPPPQSSSPIPAPIAQRKQNLADALHAETRSPSVTPSIETPSASVAPWAKEPAEAPKGPSLKEIQEMEARKAAQQEELAAAARRAAFEKELLVAQTVAAPAAPGLPSSSTWASSASPSTPLSATATSAWVKPLAGKTPVQNSASAKRTLQQIQKEEEARKQRSVAAAVTVASAIAGAAQILASGKRYADLASKTAPPAPSVGGGAWTTVGASGKVKTPAAPAPTAPAAAVRAAGSGVVAAAKPRPVATAPRSSATPANQVNAQEEFKKWAVGELRQDLNKGINGRRSPLCIVFCPRDF